MTEIINGIPQPVDTSEIYVKATYFEIVSSGITSGTVTKPAGNNSEVAFILDEWGSDTDALISTLSNGKPTFKSPVDSGGNTITTTFNTSGEFAFSGTPAPAGDHAVVFVYKCYLKNFDADESLFESELVPGVAAHAASHTDGTDDIQSATNAQKGLATAAQIAALEANTAHKTSDGSDHSFIDQDVSSGAEPTFDGGNFTNISAEKVIIAVKERNVSAITKGQVCAVTGSSGVKFEVGLCDCDDSALIRIVGLASADITQNENGQCVYKGELTGVDTQIGNTDVNPNGETWTAGDLLWVANTAGGLTNVRPVTGRNIKAARTLKGNSASDTLLAIAFTNPVRLVASAGENVVLRTGDSAGANKVSIRDYGNNEVASVDSNGNLALIGLADGRDVAVDGTKLDGIEEGATVGGITDADAIKWAIVFGG